MERSTFDYRLRAATSLAVEFARRMVRQVLPPGVDYRVYTNQSCDQQPLVDDEVVFPEDSLPEAAFHGPWSTAQVIEFLWREGRVPEWIDISVEAVVNSRTVVGLLCCGRFSARDGRLYYNVPGELPPFGIKSPVLPPRWEGVESSGRFDLDWRLRRNGLNPPAHEVAAMSLPRLRFTVRRMMVVVAVVLATVVALRKRSENLWQATAFHAREAQSAADAVWGLQRIGRNLDGSVPEANRRLTAEFWVRHSHHKALEQKYAHAARYPWLPVPPDPRKPE
jgi:hypothetical protein